MERVSRRNMIPSAVHAALKDIAQAARGAGIDVIGPLVDAGSVDMVVNTLSVYQMLGDPAAASVTAVQ